MKALVSIAVGLYLLVCFPLWLSPESVPSQEEVTFDMSSIEKIFQNPEEVLEDVQGFWENEAAYMATKKWEPPGYPIHYGEFEGKVSELANQRQIDRDLHPDFVFAKKILEAAPGFYEKGLDHVLSYLPDETVLKARVLLGCFIYLGKQEPKFSPSGFVVGDSVVFNVSHKTWNFDTSEILHLLTHELVHVAHHQFHETLPLQDADTPQKLIDHILWQLHNEGMATYIAYRVQEVLPTTEDRDYLLLESPDEVKRLIGDVNQLLEQAKTEPLDRLEKEVIERGISQRAFYVVGAYMAQSIEKKLGKDFLVSSFLKGPSHFVKLFNSIAVEDVKIRY
jgi:hypothetical protein